MADHRNKLQWYTSKSRAIFPKCEIRMSHSMRKFCRQTQWKITFDTAFEQTIRACMRPKENWINEELIDVFCVAHQMGLAQSCEVWDENGQLIGGTYGLILGRIFCAESMFHRKTNASKLALLKLGEHRKSLGTEFIDAQVMSPHLASLGAVSTTSEEYSHELSLFGLAPELFAQSGAKSD